MSTGVTPTRANEYRNLLVLSFGFFLVFSAFFAIQNLQSSLNEEGGLGVVSLACLYGGFVVSAVVSPLFIRFLGAKWTICLHFAMTVVYTATNFNARWTSLIPSSILLGLVAGAVWTAQGVYITYRSTNFTKISKESLHTISSHFNGIFFAIFLMSQVLGNLISSLILFHSTRMNHQRTINVTIMNLSQLNYTFVPHNCGSSDCPVVVTNVSSSTTFPQPPSDLVSMLFAVFCALEVLGLIITAVFLQKIPKEDQLTSSTQTSMTSTFMSCIELSFKDVKMALLIPLFVSQTMIPTIFNADFTKSYVSCVLGIGMVGYVMTAYGVSTFVFSVTLGRLAKYTGRMPQMVAVEIVYTAFTIFLYFWIPDTGDFYMFFIVSTILGVGEPVMLTQGSALMAVAFPDQADAAFANFYTWRGVGFTLSFALSNIMCVWSKLILTGFIHIIGFAMYMLVEWLVYKTDTNIRKNESGEAYGSIDIEETNDFEGTFEYRSRSLT